MIRTIYFFLFLIFVLYLIFVGLIRIFIIIYAIFVNLLAVGYMYYDKKLAKSGKNNYRIPEKTLFSIAMYGGAFFLLLSMLIFRHKTNKFKFIVGIPIILIVNLVIYSFCFKIFFT